MTLRLKSEGGFSRQKKSNLAASLVLGLALIAGAILVRESKDRAMTVQTAPVVSEFDTVEIPVPVDPVAAGTSVKEIKFRTSRFPEHQVPADALRALDSIINAVAIAPLPAGLPLFEANFSHTAHVNNPVLERIPAGMRAMTVKVDATSAVEGWAGSGSIVDVLLIEKNRTAVVAEKVKILSAERSVSPVEGSSAPNVPSTVTLLVTQEQCLAINTAIPLGRIAFALRSARDQESWAQTVYTPEKLKGGAVVAESKGAITGYISVSHTKGRDAFALSDGRWVRTEIVPEGFFVSERR